MEGACPLPRAQTLTLGGPGSHLSPVDLEGIVGKDGNQDDAKHLWEQVRRSGDDTTKAPAVAITYYGEGGGRYGARGVSWSPGRWLGLVGRHRECANTSQRSLGPGELCGAGLTKAAMAAPSREVTAAKETTRKMMMALTQRRKSWGAEECRVKGKSRGQENITLRFSRLVRGLTLRHHESLHGDTPGHNIKHLRVSERAREGMQVNAKRPDQESGARVQQGWGMRAGRARAGAGPSVSGRAALGGLHPRWQCPILTQGQEKG